MCLKIVGIPRTWIHMAILLADMMKWDLEVPHFQTNPPTIQMIFTNEVAISYSQQHWNRRNSRGPDDNGSGTAEQMKAVDSG